VVGLALAFFAYNHGLPLTLRSAFYPILVVRHRFRSAWPPRRHQGAVGGQHDPRSGPVAAVLLLVGGTGALDALRAMTVSTGLPFTLVLLAMCYSIWVGLWAAVREKKGV